MLNSALNIKKIRLSNNVHVALNKEIPLYVSTPDNDALLFFGIDTIVNFNQSLGVCPCSTIGLKIIDNNTFKQRVLLIM